MKTRTRFLGGVAILAFSFSSCERRTVIIEVPPTPAVDLQPEAKTKTLETARLGSAVDAYAKNPNAATDAGVQKAIAELDGEIAELKERVATHTGSEQAEAAAKLTNLQEYRAKETARFTLAKAQSGLTPSSETDGRSAGQKVEDAAQKAGKSIEKAADKIGDAVKDAVR